MCVGHLKDEKTESYSSYTLASDAETASETQEATKPDFSIAEREHRLSFTPRLNRDLIGLRPTVTSRMSFRENWFREQKNASLNGNVSLGMNLSIQKWFGWFLKTEKPPETQTPADGPQNGTPPSLEIEDPPESSQSNDATKIIEQLRKNGIDETQIQELEEDRGDWIERDKGEVVNGEAQANIAPVTQEGFLHRVLKSFTISTNANFTATESYRQLASGLSALEIWSLADDAKERTNSRRSNRYSLRGSVKPWSWVTLGTNVSTSNSSRKSSGTPYKSHAESYEADMKLNTQKKTSFQVRYSFTKRDNATLETILSDSKAHTPSLSWIHTWGDSETPRTALGIRTTFRDHQRSGIQSNAVIVTPNLSIDYRYHTENGIRIPFINKRIHLSTTWI